MTAHDQLEAQLARSVGALAPVPRRGGGRRRRAGMALVPLALAGSVGAAAALTGGAGTEERVRRLELRAFREADAQACRPVRSLPVGRLVAGAVPREVSDVLPALRDPARALPAGASAAVKRTPQPIVRSSLLVARFAGGLRVAAGVGPGGFGPGLASPAACLSAREAVVVAARPDPSDPVRRRALTHLRADPDVRPGAQVFAMWNWRFGEHSTGGAANQVVPGASIATGLLGGGSGRYFGVVRPGTAVLDVRSQRTGRRLVRLHPQDGLFGFELPAGTGPATLRQLSADGRVLARSRLRR